MSITRAEVEHVARLARLALEPAELERMTAQLNSILEHVGALREVDVTGIEPFSIAAHSVAPPRPDEPGADPLLRPVEQLAVSWLEGFFTVPQLVTRQGRAPEDH